tara:strand:- start:107 stop:1084 length:978 start_codon:yes stop_codon:yes gene_type:complete
MSKANYLLIGYGYWGPNVARNINKSKISNLKAVIDVDKKSIKKAKNDKVSESYFDSIERLNTEIMKDIDVIVVTTPPSSHFKIINTLSKYRKTFLIAKPLCTNATEVVKIEKLIKKYNLEIFTDETFVYSNKVKAIKKTINSDNFGKLQYISSIRSNLGLIQKDQNVIWDLAPHDLSIISFVTSYYPLSGKAISTNSLSDINSTDNISYVEFKYKNNLKLFLNVSWVSPEKIRYMVFCGTKQTLVYDDNKKYNSITLYNQEISHKNNLYDYVRDQGTKVKYQLNEPLFDEIHKLSFYIINKTNKPFTTFENSKKNILALANLKYV